MVMAEAVAIDMPQTSEEADVPAGYRRTQIGIIPEDWELKPIGELLEFKNGLNKAKQYFGYGTPIINYMDVFEHTGIRREHVAGLVDVTRNEIEAYSARKGDVLFTRTSETLDEIGYASVVMEEIDAAVFSGFVLRGRPKSDELLDGYKRYCFRSEQVRQQIVSKGTYTTRALTNGRALASVVLPYPKDQGEQLAIASALSDQDNLITNLISLIKKKREIKKGSMLELLTGKRRLPGFCGDWEVKTFDEVLQRHNAKSHQILASTYMFVGALPVVDQGKESIVGYTDNTRKAFRVPSGGVIVFGDHTCISKFVEFDFVVGADGTQILSAKNGHVTRFHAYDLELNGIEPTGYNRHFKELKERRFHSPSHDEQAAISSVLGLIDDEIDALSMRLKKAIQIKAGMMQSLLTGRVRLV